MAGFRRRGIGRMGEGGVGRAEGAGIHDTGVSPATTTAPPEPSSVTVAVQDRGGQPS